MKRILIIIFAIILSLPAVANENCFDAFGIYFKTKAHPQDVAEKILFKRQDRDLPVILDIGGEGRYQGAINLNPNPLTSTTGEPDRIIPNWVPGIGDDIPLPNRVVDEVILENAPIGRRTLYEINRVSKSGSKVYLSHPIDYAETYYQRARSYFGQSNVQRVDEGIISKITITIP